MVCAFGTNGVKQYKTLLKTDDITTKLLKLYKKFFRFKPYTHIEKFKNVFADEPNDSILFSFSFVLEFKEF